ncbi:dipeptidase D [Acetoanaerobium pronyense]|uniref:Dipeptidase D n=1 Tax=Acetoanaerobium pronyense TaxID=1482736 RepID=A0ABS4KH49_9FIRM|nr:aminoacyl-histidine dipeptidase [Acetoanaerobium pronyense]MBP2026685.1 dipeptidase D [Acetoanaerobium pronyense]
MDKILNFKPHDVFAYFEEISKIPRGSGNEQRISDYLVDFAKSNNLSYIRDNYNNVIIKKNGTKGYENLPTVILQGHMDMVNEKNNDKVHDFENDPLSLVIKGDMIFADNTTLGADNGIALAMTMAILSSDSIEHPPIEAVFTVEEETGLVGAYKLDASSLNGEYLINLDSEEEGELLVSCAGGARTKMLLPVDYTALHGNYLTYHISVKGLKGGHSGMDIIKGRGNSNIIMGRILNDLQGIMNFEIFSINGGSKMNAIPRECDLVIGISPKDKENLEFFVDKFEGNIKNELREKDDDVKITLNETSIISDKVLNEDSKSRLIAALMLIPNGVYTMSASIENLVESSSNLGIVTTNSDHILFESAVRSSVNSLKKVILQKQKNLANLLWAELTIDSDYPEWQYNPDSKLRTHFQNVYKKLTGKAAHITAIHAGVECGLFKEKMPNLDMISIGPNMYDVHTPNEHISISSVERTYEYLLAILKDFKNIESI